LLRSDRKIKANRANARASTGPRTARGRARAARNALRHGLSLPRPSDYWLWTGMNGGPCYGAKLRFRPLMRRESISIAMHADTTYSCRVGRTKPNSSIESTARYVETRNAADLLRAGAGLRTVRFAGVVYVLHAFQKKSKHGRATPKAELDLINQRLKRATEDYEQWSRSEKPVSR